MHIHRRAKDMGQSYKSTFEREKEMLSWQGQSWQESGELGRGGELFSGWGVKNKIKNPTKTLRQMVT